MIDIKNMFKSCLLISVFFYLNQIQAASQGPQTNTDYKIGIDIFDWPEFNGIYDAKFSADGKLMICIHFDRHVRIWNITTRESLHDFNCEDDPCTTAILVPDGKALITVHDASSNIRIWDLETKQYTYKDTACSMHIISMDGQQVFYWRANPISKIESELFNLQTEKHRAIKIHEKIDERDWILSQKHGLIYPDQTLTAAFSRDGKTLATGHYNGTLQINDLSKNTYREIKLKKSINTIALNANGTKIVSTHDDNIVRITDLATRHIFTLDCNGPVKEVIFCTNDDFLIYLHSDNKIKMIETQKGATHPLGDAIEARALQQVSRNKFAFISNGRVVIYTISTGNT